MYLLQNASYLLSQPMMRNVISRSIYKVNKVGQLARAK